MFLLHDLFLEQADRHAERPALIEKDVIRSYSDLAGRSGTLAAALQEWGVERGERVVLMAGNSLDTAESVWSVLSAGGVVVPLRPESKPARVRALVQDCAARTLIAAPELAETVTGAISGLVNPARIIWTTPPPGRESEPSLAAAVGGRARHPIDPGLIDQDLAAIIYTSGTTGEPKGVTLTHRNLANTTASIASYLGQTPEDVTCCLLPMSFSYGLFQVLAAGGVGSAVVLEQSFVYPFDVLKRIEAHRATMFPAVPTIFAKLLQMLPLEGVDIGSVRCITNAAAPIPPAHVLRLFGAFPQARFYAMYGQTECTRATFLDPSLAASRPSSVGRAIPNCEAYLVDEQGRRLPPGSEGELVVRGANVMRGYWGRPEQTARTLRDGDIPGEKVLMTGDRFRTDTEGLLYFVSRTDDIFKCRGEKVAPCAIEHVLCEISEVAEAAVVGVEDPSDGMAIKAVIVLKTGCQLSESRVREHCRLRLEPVFVPRFIEMREALPKTDSGKLRRHDLREQTSA